MSEINFNALSRSTGLDKSATAAGGQKQVAKNDYSKLDSAEFSKLPDFSSIENNLEDEFATLRARLEERVNSSEYPPLDTIDQLAQMFATNLVSRK